MENPTRLDGFLDNCRRRNRAAVASPMLLAGKSGFDEVIMVIDIAAWMKEFLQALNESFENRVWFVGLQGSYGRGEATETSDIDVVVILDELAVADGHVTPANRNDMNEFGQLLS